MIHSTDEPCLFSGMGKHLIFSSKEHSRPVHHNHVNTICDNYSNEKIPNCSLLCRVKVITWPYRMQQKVSNQAPFTYKVIFIFIMKVCVYSKPTLQQTNWKGGGDIISDI